MIERGELGEEEGGTGRREVKGQRKQESDREGD